MRWEEEQSERKGKMENGEEGRKESLRREDMDKGSGVGKKL